MNWVRQTKLNSYVKSGDMCPPEEDLSLARRYYTPKGKKYPLLCIAIHTNTEHSVGYYVLKDKKIVKEPLSGINISQSLKKKAGEWRDSFLVCIPFELLDDVLEMIAEVRNGKR